MLNFHSFFLNNEVLFLNQDSTFLCLCQAGSISFIRVSCRWCNGVAGVAIVANVAVEVSDKLWLLCLPPELGEEESKSLVCS